MKKDAVKKAEIDYKATKANITVNKDLDKYTIVPGPKVARARAIASRLKLPE